MVVLAITKKILIVIRNLVVFSLILFLAVITLPVSVPLLLFESLLRRRLKADVRIDIEPGHAKNVLIVYLPGILAGARASSVDLIEIWRQRAENIMLVEYGDDRFDGCATAKNTFEAIQYHLSVNRFGESYERIIFIGSSMGGLLAYDIIQHIKQYDIRVSKDLILLDTPTSLDDFQPPNDKTAPLLRFLPFGPILNKFNLVSLMFVPPKEQNIEEGVDRKELSRRVDEGKSFRVSFWRDELMYIMDHGIPIKDSLEGLVDRLVYVRSKRDVDTVRPEAFDKWFATTKIASWFEVDSTHVGFAERPKTWQRAFEILLDM